VKRKNWKWAKQLPKQNMQAGSSTNRERKKNAPGEPDWIQGRIEGRKLRDEEKIQKGFSKGSSKGGRKM